MRPERYNAKEAEPKWQAVWAEKDLFRNCRVTPRPDIEASAGARQVGSAAIR